MTTEIPPDVPSPIDLRLMSDAREWELSAMSKRPWRMEFISRFANEIAVTTPMVSRVLELGSGPGFLAKHILETLNTISYVLLDFSPAMHELANARLGKLVKRAEFIERSFKQADWFEHLGQFNCVVTLQAIHELRHKRHACELHTQVRQVLAVNGIYIVCDHYAVEGGMKNNQLYMTIEEQKAALLTAGFSRVEQLMLKRGLVMHRAN